MTNSMTTPSEVRTVIVGVDTHKHVHVAVALDTRGIRVGDQVVCVKLCKRAFMATVGD